MARVRVRVRVLCIRVRVLTEELESESESLKIWTRVRLEYTVGLKYYITGHSTQLVTLLSVGSLSRSLLSFHS